MPDEVLGRRLFRDGVTAAGEPVRAELLGGVPLGGDAAACALCHGAGGHGIDEGTVEAPALLARALFAPRVGTTRDRPAYTERTLLEAITRGRTASGRELGGTMPRFDLEAADRANLLAWLRSLGDRPSRGVRRDVVRVGAALPLSGPQIEAGEDARAALQASFAEANRNGGVFGRAIELLVEDSEAVSGGRGGIERLIDAGVLALVASAGVDSGAARARIDDEGVPVIGPLGPHPASGGTVFALGPGLDRQAQAAFDQLPPGAVGIVAADDREGSAWRSGAETEATRKRRRTEVLTFVPGRFDATAAAGRLRDSKVCSVMFAGAASDLKSLLDALGGSKKLHRVPVVAPAALVGLDGARAADHAGVPLALTSTVRPTRDGLALMSKTLAREGIRARHVSVQSHALASAQVFEEALRRAGEDLSPESLIIALESLRGLDTGVLPPIAFGRGQRTGSIEVETVQISAPGSQPPCPGS